MEAKIKVLFVRWSHPTIVERDLELLKKHFDVKVVDFVLSRRNLKGSLATAFNMIKGALWADVTFTWVADSHARVAILLSKFFRKKSIVVAIGYEVANIPEIGYGATLNPKHTRVVRFVLRKADIVLTVDESLKEDAIRNVGVDGGNIQTIPTGYEYEIFIPKGEKGDSVITVSGAISWMKVQIKGVDTFVKSAEFLPNIKFIVIGLQGEALKMIQDIKPANVEIAPSSLLADDLIPYYQKAKVYCQLSMKEGLPSALCEAMLCECVPVGTDVQGVREAIGDTGFYVPYGDPKATAEAVKMALNSHKGKKARERIKTLFPIEGREKELIRIINELLK